jgi:hypothetical protein
VTRWKNDKTKDFEALGIIVDALKALEPDSQRRVLMTVATFIDLHLTDAHETTHRQTPRHAGPPRPTAADIASFSENRELSPKEFLRDKQPRTDVERVTCLAFYLTHYRAMPHFKTIDISALNTEAAQPKFSSASVAVDNAARSGYLVAAQKGAKQLSSLGEVFIQHLPDRDAAKGAVANMKPRRRIKRTPRKSTGPENTNNGPEQTPETEQK